MLCEEYQVALKEFQAKPVEVNPKQPLEVPKVPVEPVMPPSLPELYKILHEVRLHTDKNSQLRALNLKILEWQEATVSDKSTESELSKLVEESKKEEVKKGSLVRKSTLIQDPKDRKVPPIRREDRKKEEIKKKEEKPEEEVKLDINQAFCQNLLDNILKAGSEFVKYNNWLPTVVANPLFPIKKELSISIDEEDKDEVTPLQSPPLQVTQPVIQPLTQQENSPEVQKF